MRDKVIRWCREQALFTPGQTVVCAVSGGMDSVCLLHLLLSLRQEFSVSVEACHYNHRLRGAESDRDEAFVRQLCASWDIPLSVGSGDVQRRSSETGESIEEAARNLRYEFFRSLGKTVATAHTENDLTETVLLNLLRGTGLKGLCGIPPKRDFLVRPILCLSRQEVETYLQEFSLPHMEDSSNEKNDYLRNRLRHETVPLLLRENPNLHETLLRMSRLLWEDEAYLSSLAKAALDAAMEPDGSLCCAALLALPAPVRTRALRGWLQTIHAPKLSAAHIDAVDALLASPNPSAACDLPGTWRAVREYEHLRLVRTELPASFSPVFLTDGTDAFLESGFHITVSKEDSYDLEQRRPGVFAVDPSGIDAATFCIRPRQTGDTLHLSGGTKSLKKRMIDCKIPAARRDRLPVLADCRGVIAVYSVGIDPERRAKPGCPAIYIEIKEEEEKDQ